jgi:hypothetical protein
MEINRIRSGHNSTFHLYLHFPKYFINRDGLVTKVTGFGLKDRGLISAKSKMSASSIQTGHLASDRPLTSI